MRPFLARLSDSSRRLVSGRLRFRSYPTNYTRLVEFIVIFVIATFVVTGAGFPSFLR
jgi:hypothetical protein